MLQSKLNKYALWVIPFLFLIYSAPSALDYIFHFPDEKYYTDSVLQMMEKDDIFTPYQADGTPRFKKPIITYWVLMSSYKLFGVSRISSRIFFWLAGALLIAITYLMAKSITGNRKTATITAFITASNPMVLMSASRSIPDILLVLYLKISAWGFLEIMILEKPKKIHFWMAYLGAALAFETKGLPAVAFAGTSILFLLFNPWKRKNTRQLFRPIPIFTAILVALSWFIVMYIEHGTMYFSSFFADQVGERVSSKSTQILINIVWGIIYLIIYLIPWVFIVFSKPKTLKANFSNSDNSIKAILGFILTWLVLMIVMAGGVFKFYDRYILPVIPLASLLIGLILVKSETGFKKTIIKILMILNINLLIINILYAVFIDANNILIIGIIFTTAVLAKWIFGIFRNIYSEVVISNAVMLLYFSGFIFLYPLLMPNPGEQLVQNLQENGITQNDKVYVYGNIRTASNIRIHSNNNIKVVSMSTIYSLPTEPNHIIVFSKKEEPFLDLTNYKIEKGSAEWSSVPTGKFPEFMQSTISNLKNSGTTYYIATPIKNKL